MEKTSEILEALVKAYRMEVESVMNYLANSIGLDGIRAEEVKEALAEEVEDELKHARKLGRRIWTLGGKIPGSLEMKFDQEVLQPPEESTDISRIIRGVIAAETEAIEHYGRIIELSDGSDWVTQDLAIKLRGDEEEHRRQFESFLSEYPEGTGRVRERVSVRPQASH